jgi:hypothetical protein
LSGDVFGSLRCACDTQLRRAFELIVDNRAGVVIYLRDGRDRRLSLQCTSACQRLDDIETQILADLGVDPGATALFPDPHTETLSRETPPKALSALDNAADRQRALLHTVLTSGRRRPRKVRL